MRFLIRGGCVLSMDQTTGNHREADVLVEDGLVAEVGRNLRARDAEVVDASGSIVMPGFVDTHRHVSDSLFRALGDLDAGPADGLASHLTSDDVYAATLVGLLGALEAGITTVVDWADLPDEHLDAALQAHGDAGTRTVFVRGRGEGWPEGWRTSLKALLESSAGGRTTIAAGAPGSLRDLTRTGQDREAARALGLRVHIHVGADPADRGTLPAAASLLDEDVTLVHCTHLDDVDFDVIHSSGATVSIAPASEMAKGFDPPPMQRLLDRDIRPGLAVDTERVAPGDMFAPMRAAISLQHATHFDLKLAGKGGLPSLLTTRQVIRYATIGGAGAVGLQAVTGSLTLGKSADLIVLAADRPNIAPVNDPIGAVVWGMDTSNVHWVFVGGEPRMRDGELLADVPRARALAADARDRAVSSAGLATGAQP